MFFVPVNYFAVLVSAIASLAVWLVWYSPMLFAKPWIKLSKLDTKKLKASKKHMLTTYTISFITAFVMAFVIALLINLTLVTELTEGLIMGSIVWLGFVATTMLSHVLFQNMPWGLFLINSGYQLASILVMSSILTLWI